MPKYIAFLRGIIVSGHHKVPMAELKAMMIKWGFHNPVTLLNSGNIIFESEDLSIDKIESDLSDKLTEHFGFIIPVMLRGAGQLEQLVLADPFKHIEQTEHIRLYVSFIRSNGKPPVQLPWSSEDNSYRILEIIDNIIISVLDLSVTKTTKGMDTLEKFFGKDITTRNWNTIMRITKKLVV